MYDYVNDKKFLKQSYRVCSDLVNQLKQNLKHYGIEADMELVGSGSRNMVTQNGNGDIDYDFNLDIISAPNGCDDGALRNIVKDAFNEVLQNNGKRVCQDSTSALTTYTMHLPHGSKIGFSIDVAIIKHDAAGTYYRLIHHKTGIVQTHQYYWNQGPNRRKLSEKEKRLKESCQMWQEVRETYLKKKNLHLQRQERAYSSYICYEEAVNEVYEKYFSSINHGYYNLSQAQEWPVWK